MPICPSYLCGFGLPFFISICCLCSFYRHVWLAIFRIWMVSGSNLCTTQKPFLLTSLFSSFLSGKLWGVCTGRSQPWRSGVVPCSLVETVRRKLLRPSSGHQATVVVAAVKSYDDIHLLWSEELQHHVMYVGAVFTVQFGTYLPTTARSYNTIPKLQVLL
jgi:hypothetical protein